MSRQVLDIEPLVDASFSRLAEVGIEGLSFPQRVLVCVWALLGEVGNGGLDQWLFNSSGDWARQTLDSLKALGANDAAALVRRAMAVFPGGVPSPELAERRLQMGALSEAAGEQLASLDAPFYQLETSLDALLREYVRAHKTEILGS